MKKSLLSRIEALENRVVLHEEFVQKKGFTKNQMLVHDALESFQRWMRLRTGANEKSFMGGLNQQGEWRFSLLSTQHRWEGYWSAWALKSAISQPL